jgi:hypothetical protein
MKLRTMAVFALPILVSLSACAAGSDLSQQAAQSGALSQIVLGFWHGLIGPFTLIGEIIQQLSPGVLPWSFDFYEAQGTGVLYDIGFFVGLIAGPSFLLVGPARRGWGSRGV